MYFYSSYFSVTGLEYNIIRVPIGGSDFSTHPYAYNELPVNDTKLTNFSLSSEDHLYKVTKYFLKFYHQFQFKIQYISN